MTDRLDTNIRQARRINRAILTAVLIMAALLVGWNWPKPADAAVVKVQVRYDVGGLWNVPAATTASGLPTSRVVRTGAATVGDCSRNCVIVFDVPSRFEYDCNGFPAASLRSRSVLVCKYASRVSVVQVSNAAGKPMTAAQRQAALTSALRSLR